LGRSTKNGEQKIGEKRGEKAKDFRFSSTFSLAVFGAAHQLAERLKEANIMHTYIAF